MLTQQQIDAIKADIELAARGAAPFVAMFGPQAVAGLVIGSAVAKQVPELVAIVERWVQGSEPTEDEVGTLKAQLAVLADPNLP